MLFESLANELLLDIFEYLDGVSLLYGFYDLNTRINYLLLAHFRLYHFDFRSISKRKFQIICKYFFPLIHDRIQSLTLSNDEETPNLADLFFSFGLTLNQFLHLKSLSFYSIESCEQLNYLINQCHQLVHLKRLQILDSYLNNGKKELHQLINNIWSLKKIEYLNFHNNSLEKLSLKKLNVSSYSIRKLFIENIHCSLDDFNHLIKQTPNLEDINLTIHYQIQDERILVGISSIKYLKITFESTYPILLKLFRMMPNLISLRIKTMDLYLKGTKWQRIIEKYLLELKIFQFRMYFQFPLRKSLVEEFSRLLNSYKTSFWIEKHQWYTACDCIPFGESYHGIVYTLPYNFDQFIRYNTIKSESTHSNQMFNWIFDKVQNFQYLNLTDRSSLLPIHFPKIRYLKIGIPFDDYFWSLIPSLDYLTSLEVILGDNFPCEQLQNLLQMSPNLYSLKVLCSLDFKIKLNQLSSSSIRRLNFIPKCRSVKGFFNSEQCTNLAYSQLGQQCQVLFLKIENRENIFDLIRTMTQLRSLIFQCLQDPWLNQTSSTSIADDEFLQWLSSSLPSTYLISRDKQQIANIRIWIDDQRI